LKLPFRNFLLKQVAIYFWIILLVFTFLVSVQTAYQRSLTTEEYAHACDSFGYLRMAKEIRQAATRREYPEFKLESEQTRLLINFMQSRNVPLVDWEELVAPHAHHYFPASGFVGVQYPPGTGLILALFPEGRAVYGLNRLVVISFLLTGLASFALAAWRQAWISVGLVVLALVVGLEILGRIGSLSFSINTALVPMLVTCLMVLASLWFQTRNRNKTAWLIAFSAGLFLGVAILIRLPAVLFAPGFLILLWPKSWRAAFRGLPAALMLGILPALIPIFVNQHMTAGSWYLSTYARNDTALPTFMTLKNNFKYYFVDGYPTVDNWALLCALIGFSGFTLAMYVTRRLQNGNALGVTYRQLFLAAFMLWLVPSVYFLTHIVTAIHYSILTIFTSIALLAFGSFAIEATSTDTENRFESRHILQWVALTLVLVTGLMTLHKVRLTHEATDVTSPVQAVAHPTIVLPPEVADERAWVWADLLTGSLWYYANKPAFKIQFSNAETRAMVFRFVFDRGDRQYLIQDSDLMQRYMDEIVSLGGTLEPRGKVDGQPYYFVRWPSDGPRPYAPPT
jgi:MFS family permease